MDGNFGAVCGRDLHDHFIRQNKYDESLFGRYDITHTPPLGKKDAQQRNYEQYAFIYRKDKIIVHESYLYDGPLKNRFAKEPFAVLIQHKGYDQLFALIGLHCKPNNAKSELDALPLLVKEIKHRWKDAIPMILGDLNADDPYLSGIRTFEKNRASMLKDIKGRIPAIFYDPEYSWLIPTGVDTTPSLRKTRSLDRIIVMKADEHHVHKAGPFYYPFEKPPYRKESLVEAIKDVVWDDNNYTKRLSDLETMSISDHFPVEAIIKLNK